MVFKNVFPTIKNWNFSLREGWTDQIKLTNKINLDFFFSSVQNFKKIWQNEITYIQKTYIYFYIGPWNPAAPPILVRPPRNS